MTIEEIMNETRLALEKEFDVLEIRHKNDVAYYYIGNVEIECQNDTDQFLTFRFRRKKNPKTKSERSPSDAIVL